MHPVLGGIPERIVPQGGLILPDGRILPPGTKVGINPWVISRDKGVYGDDADVFRPERWLRAKGESEDEYEERLKGMKAADFTFGAGRRVCVGQHMATVEIHKLTSTLFSRFDVSTGPSASAPSTEEQTLLTGNLQLSLDPKDSEWRPRWWWFCFIDNIKVKIQRRSKSKA